MSIMKKIGAFLILMTLIATPFVLGAQTAEIDRAKLEAELAALEKEIAAKQKILDEQKKQTGSIKRDVSVLTAEIEKARANIRAKSLTIQKLTSEINEKNNAIKSLSSEMERRKLSLASLIQRTHEMDNASVLHIVFGNDSVSDFYNDLESYAVLKNELKSSVDSLKVVKGQTEEAKNSLEEKRDAELDAKAALESSKRKVEVSQQEKNKLLKISEDKEKEYQKVLAERQARAAEIRATLFPLRDSGPIPFGKAYEYALLAEKQTGVDPAFLLAIFQQESNFGSNVGSCYMTDPDTGDGVKISSGAKIDGVMKVSRDVEPFLHITKALGRDFKTTRVSCPLSYGYGGAMGPAQFIPSTWIIMEDRVAKAVGAKAADPWNPYHAFMASSMYLADLGADSGSYSDKRNAACRYYSGRSCSGNSNGTSYGNQVMKRAANIQENMIDPLNF